ncbi:hypothetical protein MVLG_01641 [Microbotryum lychnidis-dioicae p1A1 Lamole]|uniref:SnoaL-like domain-containing protein n=1 Tax=Microbotryum lychnidis-dioicae (strain p1A1 Lamole / MvSl-1064) TaxID=683840 RepID=U5H2Q8_USTV1|nr:hypothetical protein MVLG_01641 [Microbotryum lychnidis-dioicae p1A1 Lamole]|eukprot:KDE08161.1 hypothetical protein MVLG_01641 [Microbotryum lychnidis-dioicae p1A1 Lamole]
MTSNATVSTAPTTAPAAGEHGLVLDERRAQLVKNVQDLFSSKPRLEIFEQDWKKDAVFEDPICIAKGDKEYMAQWYGMPKAFPQSETLSWKVLKNEPGLIEYEQVQKYTVAGIHTVKEMKSLVHIELDPTDNKITRFEDRWNGKEMKSGWLGSKLRSFNGRFMPSLISVPKPESKL